MIQLSEADARTRLEQMLQHDKEPVLTEPEVTDLLKMAKRADEDGLTPSEEGWIETWDLNAAAAEGWQRKAGKVAGRFDATLDGATLRRAQIFASCLKMAQTYASKVAASVVTSPYRREHNSVANL